MIAARQIAFGKAAGKKEETPAYWGLCFTAEEAGSTIKMNKVGTSTVVTLETSYDGDIWEPFTSGKTTITLPKVGDTVFFRAGEGGNTTFYKYSDSYHRFVMSGKIAANGSIMSLLQGDAATYTLENAGNDCFNGLFANCTSLVSAPELPATKLSRNCYTTMFYKCTSLVSAPELPARSTSSYYYMFYGCEKLEYVKTKLTSFPSLYSNSINNWLSNVAPIGTFVCPTALGTNETIQRGASYCPEGWTVINED